MTFRLIDRDWDSEFTKGLAEHSGELRIVCPFIKCRALVRILSPWPTSLRVITRFNLSDFARGVSDMEALRRVLDAGGAVRGVQGLHAKLYIFGAGRAIVTSANLTGADLTANREFGVVTEDGAAVKHCLNWFDALWRNAGGDLQRSQLDDWTRSVSSYLASGAPPKVSGDLGDFGAVVRIKPPSIDLPTIIADPPQAFVKFLGHGSDRSPLDRSTIKAIKRSGCHWALAYPSGGGRIRPTGVRDSAVMFISRLVKEPNDIRIFGRAVALKHKAERDDATAEDIKRRPWKDRWPRYIRVHHAEFVAGTMRNGISLNVMMDTLGSDSFESTRRNMDSGRGNTNPRMSIRQQPAVELSNKGFEWLNVRLESAFENHGRVPLHDLRKLDWPELPADPKPSP